MKANLLLVLIVLISSCNPGNNSKPILKKTNEKTPNKKRIIIYIQPYNGFPKERLNLVSKEIDSFFKTKTIVLPYKDLPQLARSQSGRYDADKLIDFLSAELRLKKNKILGLTNEDIFTNDEERKIREWGIFGLGSCPGNSCIVSDNRLLQFTNHTDDFVVKVVLHDICHNFGLEHCDKDEKCLMNDAKGTIESLFKEKRWLCPECLKKLRNIQM